MALERETPNEKGWSDLVRVSDEPHLGAKFPKRSKPLFVLHHLSDLHICDAQSPIRPEFLDRWADPDSPIRDMVGTIGTYRPQSMLAVQVLEAMVQSLNKIKTGPLSGHPVDAAIITGDTTDNAQINEVDWYIQVLDGGQIRPDSGSHDKYEGVADGSVDHYDTKYWHPHGTPSGMEEDDARLKYGFPVVPGLLDSCRMPFKASGLEFPWYAVHGNHDALLQGTVTPEAHTQEAMISDKRYLTLPSSISLDQILGAFNEVGPATYPPGSDAAYVIVTPDLDRRALERGEYAEKHLTSSGLPKGHGFSQKNIDQKTMYYATQVGGVNLIVIDSVNHFGGWQGSLDIEQFEWLENQISRSKIPCVLASHHPLSTMINDYAPHGERVCLGEIEAMLIKYPQVIVWLAGHEHRHHVEWVGPKTEEVGFWHIETSSHIDWPQQSRTIEIVETENHEIYIGLTVIDHEGDISYGEAQTPIEIAALSRVLSANVWQRRDSLGAKHSQDWAKGEAQERNTVLRILRS